MKKGKKKKMLKNLKINKIKKLNYLVRYMKFKISIYSIFKKIILKNFLNIFIYYINNK